MAAWVECNNKHEEKDEFGRMIWVADEQTPKEMKLDRILGNWIQVTDLEIAAGAAGASINDMIAENGKWRVMTADEQLQRVGWLAAWDRITKEEDGRYHVRVPAHGANDSVHKTWKRFADAWRYINEWAYANDAKERMARDADKAVCDKIGIVTIGRGGRNG